MVVLRFPYFERCFSSVWHVLGFLGSYDGYTLESSSLVPHRTSVESSSGIDGMGQ
jgi:hypothetical protein